MSKPRVVFLHLRTWRETVPHAEHYYADLVRRKEHGGYEKDIKKLWHKLTFSETERANRRCRREDGIPYEEGEEVGWFFDEQRAIEEAIAQYKTLFPGADVLVKGDVSIYEPQFVVDSPDADDMKTLNELAQAAEDIDWWEEDEEAMQEICDKYRAIWIPKYVEE